MSRARFSASLIAVLVTFVPLAVHAASITQTVNSSADTTAWEDAIWGAPAAVPSAGNVYLSNTGFFSANATRLGVNVTGRIRSYGGIFGGDSLEVVAGTELLLKDSGGATHTGNLVLDNGGVIRLSPNVAGSHTLAGAILVTGESYIGVVHANPTTLTIHSTISGGSTLRLRAGDGASNRLVFTGNFSGFSGTLDVGGGTHALTVNFTSSAANLTKVDLRMGGYSTLDRLDLSADVTFRSLTFGTAPLDPGSYSAGQLNALFGNGSQFLANGGTLTVLEKRVWPRVFIIGDSTVNNTSPRRGWGQEIYRYFNSSITITNNANPGESSETFITENRWANTISQVAENDIVLIQFGHNDSHNPIYPEATDSNADYKTYLKKYIDETRAKGAIPVLVTPMYRRNFVDGVLQSYALDGDGYPMDLAPYAAAMKQVAQANNVACIDLFARSGLYMQLLGDEQCKSLLAIGDVTHWNQTGAIVMAGLVAKGLPEVLKTAVLPVGGEYVTQYLRPNLFDTLYNSYILRGTLPGPVLALDREDGNFSFNWFFQPTAAVIQRSTNLATWLNSGAGTSGSFSVPQSGREFFRISQP